MKASRLHSSIPIIFLFTLHSLPLQLTECVRNLLRQQSSTSRASMNFRCLAMRWRDFSLHFSHRSPSALLSSSSVNCRRCTRWNRRRRFRHLSSHRTFYAEKVWGECSEDSCRLLRVKCLDTSSFSVHMSWAGRCWRSELDFFCNWWEWNLMFVELLQTRTE